MESCPQYGVFTDGSSLGNPGPAGSAAVLVNMSTNEVIHEVSLSIGVATNNVAEYRALILGIAAIQDELGGGGGKVTIYSDSQLALKHISREYKAKEPTLVALLARVRDMVSSFKSPPAFQHVRAHSGIVHNERADYLAKRAAEGSRVATF